MTTWIFSFLPTVPIHFQDIDRWVDYISELQFRNKRTGVVKRMLPFKLGWLTTLKAVKLLVSDLLSLDGITFVLTRRLNQDAIEVSIRLFIFWTTTPSACIMTSAFFLIQCAPVLSPHLGLAKIVAVWGWRENGVHCTSIIKILNIALKSRG